MIQAIDVKCYASCGILMFGIGVWEFQLNKEGWGKLIIVTCKEYGMQW